MKSAVNPACDGGYSVNSSGDVVGRITSHGDTGFVYFDTHGFIYFDDQFQAKLHPIKVTERDQTGFPWICGYMRVFDAVISSSPREGFVLVPVVP